MSHGPQTRCARLHVSATSYRPSAVRPINCTRGCVTEQKRYHTAKNRTVKNSLIQKDKGNNKQQRLTLVPFGISAFPRSSPSQSISLCWKKQQNFHIELKVTKRSKTRDSKITNENGEQVMRVWDIFVLIFQKSSQDRKTLLNSLRSQLI